VRARIVPAVPVVERRRHVGGDRGRIDAVDDDLFTGRDGRRLTVRRRDGRTAATTGDERRSIPADIDAIVAGVVDGEGRVRRVDLHDPAGFERTKIERNVTGGHFELQVFGILVHHSERRIGPTADERAWTNLQLGIAWGAGGDLVSRAERSVDLCGD